MRLVTLKILLLAACAWALIMVVSHEHGPHQGSPYERGGTLSLLMDGDFHLRACDTRSDGLPATAWSQDTQTGNFAFATDGTGANDGNCTNKWLNTNHDRHGVGGSRVDARASIQQGWYSRH